MPGLGRASESASVCVFVLSVWVCRVNNNFPLFGRLRPPSSTEAEAAAGSSRSLDSFQPFLHSRPFRGPTKQKEHSDREREREEEREKQQMRCQLRDEMRYTNRSSNNNTPKCQL